jgi:hypothetical protein
MTLRMTAAPGIATMQRRNAPCGPLRAYVLRRILICTGVSLCRRVVLPFCRLSP